MRTLVWVRGQAQPRPPATQPGPQPEQRIYLDGPLLKIIKALQDVAATLKRIETGTAEEIRVIGDIEHPLEECDRGLREHGEPPAAAALIRLASPLVNQGTF